MSGTFSCFAIQLVSSRLTWQDLPAGKIVLAQLSWKEKSLKKLLLSVAFAILTSFGYPKDLGPSNMLVVKSYVIYVTS